MQSELDFNAIWSLQNLISLRTFRLMDLKVFEDEHFKLQACVRQNYFVVPTISSSINSMVFSLLFVLMFMMISGGVGPSWRDDGGSSSRPKGKVGGESCAPENYPREKTNLSFNSFTT